MSHSITEISDGLTLEVDDAPVATIRDRQGNRDLIWEIRGPKDLETSRRMVMGLLDLLVHYDALNKAPIAHEVKSIRKDAKSIKLGDR